MKPQSMQSDLQRNNKPIFADNFNLKVPIHRDYGYEFSKSEKTLRATFFNR